MVGWYANHGLTADEKRRFGELVGKRVVSYRTRHGGWLTRIPTPHHHLHTFLEWTAQRNISINEVHVAFDLEGLNAGELRRIRNHLVIAYAPSARKFPIGGSR